jgi:hypothetical protein
MTPEFLSKQPHDFVASHLTAWENLSPEQQRKLNVFVGLANQLKDNQFTLDMVPTDPLRAETFRASLQNTGDLATALIGFVQKVIADPQFWGDLPPESRQRIQTVFFGRILARSTSLPQTAHPAFTTTPKLSASGTLFRA